MAPSVARTTERLEDWPVSRRNPERLDGFEPTTPCLENRCSNQLSYNRMLKTCLGLTGPKMKSWSDRRDSNPRPSTWQADVLTN